jgi:hypothetical protein
VVVVLCLLVLRGKNVSCSLQTACIVRASWSIVALGDSGNSRGQTFMKWVWSFTTCLSSINDMLEMYCQPYLRRATRLRR